MHQTLFYWFLIINIVLFSPWPVCNSVQCVWGLVIVFIRNWSGILRSVSRPRSVTIVRCQAPGSPELLLTHSSPVSQSRLIFYSLAFSLRSLCWQLRRIFRSEIVNTNICHACHVSPVQSAVLQQIVETFPESDAVTPLAKVVQASWGASFLNVGR